MTGGGVWTGGMGGYMDDRVIVERRAIHGASRASFDINPHRLINPFNPLNYDGVATFIFLNIAIFIN